MPDSSILTDVGKVIDEALGLKNSRFKYQHKKSCQLFSKGPAPDLDRTDLIGKIFDRIQSNWHKGKSRSNNQNWRWKPNPEIADENTSREVFLERLIIKTQVGADWVNQVPVASGLTSRGGGRRAIDLVHRGENDWYELIELKLDRGSQRRHPLICGDGNFAIRRPLYLLSREGPGTRIRRDRITQRQGNPLEGTGSC